MIYMRQRRRFPKEAYLYGAKPYCRAMRPMTTIIAAFEKHADDTSLIAQYAPDEFAALFNDGEIPSYEKCHMRFIKMPAVIGGTHSPQDKICGNKFVDNHIFCIFVHKQTQYGIY